MKSTTDNGAKAFLARIEETEFFAHYSMLGEGNIRQFDWEKLESKLTGVEKGLWKFLLLAEPLAKTEAAKLFGAAALKFLLKHKLCKTVKGKLSMGSIRLIRFWGLTFFIERGVSVPAYIGDDSKALLSILPKLNGGRCLSFYTAGGLEVMPLVTGAKVEMNFVDAKADEGILRANLELNAAAENPRPCQFSRNGTGSYDLIVSNPPYYIQAPGVKLPKYAAGGPDGLKCVRRVLQAASKELAPHGQALLTFVFFADLDNTIMEQHLRALLDPYGLNYRVAISSKLLMEPGVPVFNYLISTAQIKGPEELEAVMKKTMRHIQRNKFDGAHLIKARFWKRENGQPAEQQITNYSDSYYGSWTI